jgi:hypothetical protein
MNGNAGDVHPAALEMDEKQHVVGHQPAQRQHLGSVLGPEGDDNVGRLGLVRLQLGLITVAPVSDIHNFSPLSFGSRQSGPGRFHDVESVAVEEEGVLPEQAVELRNHRMVVRNNLSFELAQSSLDLCGSPASSHTPVSIGLAPLGRSHVMFGCCGASHLRWSSAKPIRSSRRQCRHSLDGCAERH